MGRAFQSALAVIAASTILGGCGGGTHGDASAPSSGGEARSAAADACEALLTIGAEIAEREDVASNQAGAAIFLADQDATTAARLDERRWAPFDSTVHAIGTDLERGHRSGLGANLAVMAADCQGLESPISTTSTTTPP